MFRPEQSERGGTMIDAGTGRLIRNNRKICIQTEQYANSILAQKGVTAVQANALQYILRRADGHGTSLTKVQREVGYSKATLSHILKTLRNKGFVRTESCAGDGRCKLIFPTEAGKQLGAYLDGAFCTMQGQLYGGFSQSELAALDHMQEKMLQNLSVLTNQLQKEASES